MKPYKLASREFQEDDSVIEIGGGKTPVIKIGGPHALAIAGPCAVENRKNALDHRPPRARRRGDGPARRSL
jgi:3-deoxy-7-phosphoheptulonate synthase